MKSNFPYVNQAFTVITVVVTQLRITRHEQRRNVDATATLIKISPFQHVSFYLAVYYVFRDEQNDASVREKPCYSEAAEATPPGVQTRHLRPSRSPNRNTILLLASH